MAMGFSAIGGRAFAALDTNDRRPYVNFQGMGSVTGNPSLSSETVLSDQFATLVYAAELHPWSLSTTR